MGKVIEVPYSRWMGKKRNATTTAQILLQRAYTQLVKRQITATQYKQKKEFIYQCFGPVVIEESN